MTLLDIMELDKLDKAQLVQLCSALYELLKERNVTVNVQAAPAPNPFTQATPLPYQAPFVSPYTLIPTP